MKYLSVYATTFYLCQLKLVPRLATKVVFQKKKHFIKTKCNLMYTYTYNTKMYLKMYTISLKIPCTSAPKG